MAIGHGTGSWLPVGLKNSASCVRIALRDAFQVGGNCQMQLPFALAFRPVRFATAHTISFHSFPTAHSAPHEPRGPHVHVLPTALVEL
eukprot:7150988-Prymnesium_polylepis.1